MRLLTRWSRQERSRRALEAAALEQENEWRRARSRLLAMSATQLLPTVHQRAPLMTRGQAARSEHAES